MTAALDDVWLDILQYQLERRITQQLEYQLKKKKAEKAEKKEVQK